MGPVRQTVPVPLVIVFDVAGNKIYTDFTKFTGKNREKMLEI